MNDMTPTSAERAAKLEGMGCKRKRVEDVRFTQGKGNYVDDLKLPGMLYGDLVRSPHAHARIKKIDTTKAAAVPGVVAVITAETLKTVNLAWMPTLAGDVQMVLADGKVLFQNQEVAFVIAENREAAADAVELVEVEYEALPCNVDPLKAMTDGAPMIREDLKDKTEGAHGKRKHYNHIFSWQAGDKAATDAAFAKADVTIREFIVYPRCHPCPLETCQCVASFDKIKGELTLWGTFQAPHVIRTVGSLISKIPEHKIHVIAPDIGGGFGNKVGAYSGYICAIVASIVTGRPVKWVEDRIENLSDHGLRPRLPHGHGNRRDQGRQGDGDALLHHRRPRRLRRLRQRHQVAGGAVQHHQRFVRFPGRACAGRWRLYQQGAGRRRLSLLVPRHRSGLLHRARHGHHGAKARHGSGRVPDEKPDPARAIPLYVGIRLAIRFRRLSHRHEQGDGIGRLQEAARRAEGQAGGLQARRDARADGHRRRLLHRNRRRRSLARLRHSRHRHVRFGARSASIRPAAGICRLGTKSQGQGHETTYAQIIATELGMPADNIMVEEGNTDTAPYGLGTYGSRSTPVSGAATAMACRKIKAKAQMIAAYMLEVHDDDLEWDVDRFRVKGNPERFKTMTELAWAAYHEVPPGMEPGLEAMNYYDPPNFTFPFGAYICVVDVDVDTGTTKVRRFYALDDCGTRINPMIIEGQIHGGLTEAFAIAMGQELHYDDDGNITTASFMDYFLPTAVETPHWETDWTTTPSPHHPIGAKGVGESPNVGGVPCFSNAVNDAFAFLGSTHIQMPHDNWRTWTAAEKLGLHG